MTMRVFVLERWRRPLGWGLAPFGLASAAMLLASGCSSDSSSSPTPTTFAVTQATIEVPPRATNWTSTGPCPPVVGLIVYVIGPKDQTQSHSYSYQWERSDAAVDGPWTRSVDVASGTPPFADHYTYTLSIPKAGTGWLQLHVLSPNDIVSNRVTWNVSCPSS
jgi:hypothetical protein